MIDERIVWIITTSLLLCILVYVMLVNVGLTIQRNDTVAMLEQCVNLTEETNYYFGECVDTLVECKNILVSEGLKNV